MQVTIFKKDTQRVFDYYPSYLIPYGFCLASITKRQWGNNNNDVETTIVFKTNCAEKNITCKLGDLEPSSTVELIINGNVELNGEEINNFGDISYCFEYLLRNYSYATKTILAAMPTSLYEDRNVMYRIANTIPDNETLIKIAKDIIKEKHETITKYRNSKKSIMDVYNETFGI